VVKNILIVTLAVTVLWFAAVIVKLENQRYAMSIGMCADTSLPNVVIYRSDCLREVETRTSPLWHLTSALVGQP
jgi:hypothetical protein